MMQMQGLGLGLGLLGAATALRQCRWQAIIVSSASFVPAVLGARRRRRDLSTFFRRSIPKFRARSNAVAN